MPINVVDRPELSTFIFPAIIDRGDVVVAVGTGGASPVLARRLRERIEALLPARIGDFAALMGRFRARVAQRQSGKLSLRRFWETVVDGPIGVAALAGRWHWAESSLSRASEHPDRIKSAIRIGRSRRRRPGGRDLLTLRALQALQAADVVFYDELVSAEILDRARRDAKRIFVGKRSGQPGMAQDVINHRLAEAAHQGLNVVRLKSGDPFIFGRGGEEIEYLREADVAVVVVPGVTAALGCAAEAGLPLSFRDEASAIAFVTAHHAGNQIRTDWSKFADPAMTVVIYMGLRNAGRDSQRPDRRRTRRRHARGGAGSRYTPGCTLPGRPTEWFSGTAAEAGEGPGLLVVGPTVARSDAWHALVNGGVRSEVSRMTSPLQQKLKITGPVVLTANRLADGAVVYRGEGGWTTKLDSAAVTTSAAVAQDLLAAARADGLHAVDAYVAPVRVGEDGRVRPGNLRERIRSSGPTIDLPLHVLKVKAEHVPVR